MRPQHLYRKPARRALCAEHGVPNTGRQFRMLRKRLGREERAAIAKVARIARERGEALAAQRRASIAAKEASA